MRLRKLELVVIGLTLAFLCFLGGYFTGVRTTVNVVSVATASGEQAVAGPASAPDTGSSANASGSSSPESPAAPEPGAQPPGSSGQAAERPGAPRDSDGRININTASRSELTDLPGIGTVLADRIVEYRNANGPYSRIEDIRNVSGIGERRFEAIMDKITVG